MIFLKKIPFILLFVALVACQNTPARKIASQHAISQSVQQLIDWETKSNAASTRSNKVFHLEHYEIPLRLLEKDFEESIDPSISSSLIFNKNGEAYVRWPINPEDSKWHWEIKKFLANHGLDSEPKKFFDAYLTASRSMILFNSENGATFSLKVSTDHTGGSWRDKKQSWTETRQTRRMNKYAKETFSRVQTKDLVLMEEPLALGIKDLDQGLIVRSLNDLPSDQHYYLPLFSALHETEGVRIAELNGAKNIGEFWEQHLVEPLARAMAEYFSATGAWHDSPHGQNFLVELDQKMKPTGRMVFRDPGDAYLLKEFLEKTDYAWMLENWEEGNVLSQKMYASVGFLHGNTPPSWLTAIESKAYGWNFFRAFEKKFSEISRVPFQELLQVDSKDNLHSYSTKVYTTTSDAWNEFINHANCMNGKKKTLEGKKCPEIFLKKHKENDCFGLMEAIIH